MEKLNSLCLRNANMALQTTNPEFDRKVQEARKDRFIQALVRYRADFPALSFSKDIPKHLQNCAFIDDQHVGHLFNQLHPHGSRSQNVEDEIHDLLKAYYDVTLQGFLYDVGHNLAGVFLVNEKGPLLGLRTEFVLGLTLEEVEALAGDEETDVISRRESDDRVERLKKAVGIARAALGRTG